MAVYLLHFDKPLGTRGSGSASHYLGWTTLTQFRYRMAEHAHGTAGTRITEAFHAIGAIPTVAWVDWDGHQALERYLKNRGHLSDRCPICNPKLLEHQHPREYLARHLYAPTPAVLTGKPASMIGGGSQAGSGTGSVGSSPRARRPAASTGSASPPKDRPPIGGTGSTATVAQPSKEGI